MSQVTITLDMRKTRWGIPYALISDSDTYNDWCLRQGNVIYWGATSRAYIVRPNFSFATWIVVPSTIIFAYQIAALWRAYFSLERFLFQGIVFPVLHSGLELFGFQRKDFSGLRFDHAWRKFLSLAWMKLTGRIGMMDWNR